jgi:hypothetical protein
MIREEGNILSCPPIKTSSRFFIAPARLNEVLLPQVACLPLRGGVAKTFVFMEKGLGTGFEILAIAFGNVTPDMAENSVYLRRVRGEGALRLPRPTSIGLWRHAMGAGEAALSVLEIME